MRFLRKIVHYPFFALSFILLIAGIVASFFVPTSNCLSISEAYTTKPINQITGILLISGFIVFLIILHGIIISFFQRLFD